ncbi:MAG: GbsR/MarR family transcriptional regulator [Candidatus Binatia bacterium]
MSALQGRIFALLYLSPRPLSLDEVAAGLEQSKGNVSVNVRGLLDWHLVRRVTVGGSRKDHYEAATDFWRVMQEIIERRFRWNLRQVLAAVEETRRAMAEPGRRDAAAREREELVDSRLSVLAAFFAAVDAGIAAFTQGKSFAPETIRNALAATIRSRK